MDACRSLGKYNITPQVTTVQPSSFVCRGTTADVYDAGVQFAFEALQTTMQGGYHLK